MRAQPSEGVCGEANPLNPGVKDIRPGGIACADGRFAAECVVPGGGEAATPFCTRIDPHLADGIDHLTFLQQENGVIAAKERIEYCLIRSRQDCITGTVVSHHPDTAIWNDATQRDDGLWPAGAPEIDLNHIGAGCQVDRGTGTIVDLDCSVVGTALDIFGDEEICGQGRGRSREWG